MKQKSLLSFFMFLFSLLCALPGAEAATLFNQTRFLDPGQFAFGLEPELIFGGVRGTGIGFNTRASVGVSTLSNLHALIGTGGGPKQFRAGLGTTIDFFPDIDKQPGIGIVVQGIYYEHTLNTQSSATEGRIETSVAPYIHKTFTSDAGEFAPFLAAPFGLIFAPTGKYLILTQASLGGAFKLSDKVRTIIELSLGIRNADTSISGGFVITL